jgi:hypothetical protein
LLLGQTIIAKAQKNQNFDTKSTAFKKMNLFRREGMSDLFNGIKKHASKSYKSIPLSGVHLQTIK